jgi:hypothetical protein
MVVAMVAGRGAGRLMCSVKLMDMEGVKREDHRY